MRRVFVITMSFAMLFCASESSFSKNDKEKSLPPGLHKKAERGQGLPPGWQKKLVVGEVLDGDIYERGEITGDEKGLLTIRIEGVLVKVIKRTRKIVEVLGGM